MIPMVTQNPAALKTEGVRALGRPFFLLRMELHIRHHEVCAVVMGEMQKTLNARFSSIGFFPALDFGVPYDLGVQCTFSEKSLGRSRFFVFSCIW